MSREQAASPDSPTELLSRLVQPAPTVIALEGGPCSGKTTLMGELAARAVGLGRPVELIPEAATEYINRYHDQGLEIADMALNDRPAFLEFQSTVLGAIVRSIEQAKLAHSGTDAVIVADRAEVASYVTPAEYSQVLHGLGLTEPPIHKLADKLVFLPSVACERPELYAQLAGTNAARYETSAEEAARVSDANLLAVRSHPELEIGWGGDFGRKIGRLVLALTEPEREGEVKQAAPDSVARLFVGAAERRGDLLNIMDITQSYHRLNSHEFRLRFTATGGVKHYHFTIKTGYGAVRHELQRSLTETEFELLKHSEQIGKTLVKQRHVVLDGPEMDGRRRLWFADHYSSPELGDWHFETDVDNEIEADELTALHAGIRRRITASARELVFQ